MLCEGKNLANSITTARLQLQYVSHINALLLQTNAVEIEFAESV
jgi:hypothetical protein